jgi:23S rRNA (guanosine2251-2'-O)-methyltransferase
MEYFECKGRGVLSMNRHGNHRIKISESQELICGINTLREIIYIRPESVIKLFVDQSKTNKRIKDISELAVIKSVETSLEKSSFFEKHFPDQNHQGVAVLCKKRLEEDERFLDMVLQKEKNLLVILDHLTDPHNVGACLRSAAAAGADAVIVPKHRSCHLTSTVRKISSGGSEILPFIVVTNLARTMKKIRESGVKIVGSEISSVINYTDADLLGRVAIVIGSEDKGLKRLTAENCDELISIGMPGKVESLNASVSAGILLFEYVRQNN